MDKEYVRSLATNSWSSYINEKKKNAVFQEIAEPFAKEQQFLYHQLAVSGLLRNRMRRKFNEDVFGKDIVQRLSPADTEALLSAAEAGTLDNGDTATTTIAVERTLAFLQAFNKALDANDKNRAQTTLQAALRYRGSPAVALLLLGMIGRFKDTFPLPESVHLPPCARQPSPEVNALITCQPFFPDSNCFLSVEWSYCFSRKYMYSLDENTVVRYAIQPENIITKEQVYTLTKSYSTILYHPLLGLLLWRRNTNVFIMLDEDTMQEQGILLLPQIACKFLYLETNGRDFVGVQVPQEGNIKTAEFVKLELNYAKVDAAKALATQQKTAATSLFATLEPKRLHLDPSEQVQMLISRIQASSQNNESALFNVVGSRPALGSHPNMNASDLCTALSPRVKVFYLNNMIIVSPCRQDRTTFGINVADGSAFSIRTEDYFVANPMKNYVLSIDDNKLRISMTYSTDLFTHCLNEREQLLAHLTAIHTHKERSGGQDEVSYEELSYELIDTIAFSFSTGYMAQESNNFQLKTNSGFRLTVCFEAVSKTLLCLIKSHLSDDNHNKENRYCLLVLLRTLAQFLKEIDEPEFDCPKMFFNDTIAVLESACALCKKSSWTSAQGDEADALAEEVSCASKSALCWLIKLYFSSSTDLAAWVCAVPFNELYVDGIMRAAIAFPHRFINIWSDVAVSDTQAAAAPTITLLTKTFFARLKQAFATDAQQHLEMLFDALSVLLFQGFLQTKDRRCSVACAKSKVLCQAVFQFANTLYESLIDFAAFAAAHKDSPAFHNWTTRIAEDLLRFMNIFTALLTSPLCLFGLNAKLRDALRHLRALADIATEEESKAQLTYHEHIFSTYSMSKRKLLYRTAPAIFYKKTLDADTEVKEQCFSVNAGIFGTDFEDSKNETIFKKKRETIMLLYKPTEDNHSMVSVDLQYTQKWKSVFTVLTDSLKRVVRFTFDNLMHTTDEMFANFVALNGSEFLTDSIKSPLSTELYLQLGGQMGAMCSSVQDRTKIDFLLRYYINNHVTDTANFLLSIANILQDNDVISFTTLSGLCDVQGKVEAQNLDVVEKSIQQLKATITEAVSSGKVDSIEELTKMVYLFTKSSADENSVALFKALLKTNVTFLSGHDFDQLLFFALGLGDHINNSGFAPQCAEAMLETPSRLTLAMLPILPHTSPAFAEAFYKTFGVKQLLDFVARTGSWVALKAYETFSEHMGKPSLTDLRALATAIADCLPLSSPENASDDRLSPQRFSVLPMLVTIFRKVLKQFPELFQHELKQWISETLAAAAELVTRSPEPSLALSTKTVTGANESVLRLGCALMVVLGKCDICCPSSVVSEKVLYKVETKPLKYEFCDDLSRPLSKKQQQKRKQSKAANGFALSSWDTVLKEGEPAPRLGGKTTETKSIMESLLTIGFADVDTPVDEDDLDAQNYAALFALYARDCALTALCVQLDGSSELLDCVEDFVNANEENLFIKMMSSSLRACPQSLPTVTAELERRLYFKTHPQHANRFRLTEGALESVSGDTKYDGVVICSQHVSNSPQPHTLRCVLVSDGDAEARLTQWKEGNDCTAVEKHMRHADVTTGWREELNTKRLTNAQTLSSIFSLLDRDDEDDNYTDSDSDSDDSDSGRNPESEAATQAREQNQAALFNSEFVKRSFTTETATAIPDSAPTSTSVTPLSKDALKGAIIVLSGKGLDEAGVALRCACFAELGEGLAFFDAAPTLSLSTVRDLVKLLHTKETKPMFITDHSIADLREFLDKSTEDFITEKCNALSMFKAMQMPDEGRITSLKQNYGDGKPLDQAVIHNNTKKRVKSLYENKALQNYCEKRTRKTMSMFSRLFPFTPSQVVFQSLSSLGKSVALLLDTHNQQQQRSILCRVPTAALRTVRVFGDDQNACAEFFLKAFADCAYSEMAFNAPSTGMMKCIFNFPDYAALVISCICSRMLKKDANKVAAFPFIDFFVRHFDLLPEDTHELVLAAIISGVQFSEYGALLTLFLKKTVISYMTTRKRLITAKLLLYRDDTYDFLCAYPEATFWAKAYVFVSRLNASPKEMLLAVPGTLCFLLTFLLNKYGTGLISTSFWNHIKPLTLINSNGDLAHFSQSDDYFSFYCGKRYTQKHRCKCGDCSGLCGPKEGCCCPACEELAHSFFSKFFDGKFQAGSVYDVLDSDSSDSDDATDLDCDSDSDSGTSDNGRKDIFSLLLRHGLRCKSSSSLSGEISGNSDDDSDDVDEELLLDKIDDEDDDSNEHLKEGGQNDEHDENAERIVDASDGIRTLDSSIDNNSNDSENSGSDTAEKGNKQFIIVKDTKEKDTLKEKEDDDDGEEEEKEKEEDDDNKSEDEDDTTDIRLNPYFAFLDKLFKIDSELKERFDDSPFINFFAELKKDGVLISDTLIRQYLSPVPQAEERLRLISLYNMISSGASSQAVSWSGKSPFLFVNQVQAVRDALFKFADSNYSRDKKVKLNRILSASTLTAIPTAPSKPFSVKGLLIAQLAVQLADAKLISTDQSWSVKFAGENGYDSGGLYRESLSVVCGEINSGKTFFIPTPNFNGKVEGSAGSDALIPALPLHNNSYFALANQVCTDDELLVNLCYRFIGKLLAVSAHTRCRIPVKLSSFVWKAMTGTPFDLSDLRAVDRMLLKSLDAMESYADEKVRATERAVAEQGEEHAEQLRSAAAAEFAAVFPGLGFVTVLPGGEVVDLNTVHLARTPFASVLDEQVIPETERQTEVTLWNCRHYCTLVKYAQLHAFDRRLESITQGFAATSDMQVVKSLSAEDAQLLFCADEEIDVERMKALCEYKECRTMNLFWEVMTEFSNEQRAAVLRFMTGFSRLGTEKLKVDVEKYATAQDLPEGHTCGRRLDLPMYPTKGIMREKLLYAVSNCTSIDDDGSSTSREAWTLLDNVPQSPPPPPQAGVAEAESAGHSGDNQSAMQ